MAAKNRNYFTITRHFFFSGRLGDIPVRYKTRNFIEMTADLVLRGCERRCYGTDNSTWQL